jgi:hypothetical protein
MTLDSEIRKIGFNETIVVKGRAYHVQTEVSVRGAPTIRSSIYEGGTLRHVENRACPLARADIVRSVAEAHHRSLVDRLVQGGFEWLEST